jgi:hypothetical protein
MHGLHIALLSQYPRFDAVISSFSLHHRVVIGLKIEEKYDEREMHDEKIRRHAKKLLDSL